MEKNSLNQKLADTLRFISTQTNQTPVLGFVLGSGLGHLADQVTNRVVLPYSEIPHFKVPNVIGHSGELVFGKLEGVDVVILKGRIHYYEGHSIDEVVYPVRTLCSLGIKTLFVTNAAGGLLKMKVPGFMVIQDQINLTGTNALLGPNDESVGPRFPDMSEAYNKKLTKLLQDCLKKLKLNYKTGVYAGLSGPTYETPAEVRYLKKCGAHAVGMSTVNEVIAARHMGVKCVGMSCITNAAAGIQKTPLNHKEVTDNAKKVQNEFVKALVQFTKSYRSKV